MSYEIVKSIRIRDNKVFLVSDSNNVFPKHYHEWECDSLTKILQGKGNEALELEIMEVYESGSFKSSSGKYVRALQVLQHMEEYKQFNWRNEPYENICKRRKSPEFRALLLRALKTQLPKDKYIIKKNYFGNDVFLTSARRFARWGRDRIDAKIFRYYEDAIETTKNYTNGNSWIIERISHEQAHFFTVGMEAEQG